MSYYGKYDSRDRNLSHGDWKYTARKWINGKWRYFYDNAEDAYGKAKKNVGDFVDKNITGETAKKSAVDSHHRAKANQRAAVNLGKQYAKELNAYSSQKQKTRDQLVSDTKAVTENTANKNYAAVHLPGHIDKANANVVKAKNTRNTNLDTNKKTEKELGSKAAGTARRVKNLNDNTKKYTDQANQNFKEYDKSLAGKAEKTAKQVKKAANEAADWAVDTYENVSKKAGEAIDTGKKYVQDTANDVADWATDTYEDATKQAAQAIEDGTNWVKGLLGGKKKKKKK